MIETEGGHVDFAPLDALEDQILAYLRRQLPPGFGRADRLPGRGWSTSTTRWRRSRAARSADHDDKALWAAALDGTDPLAAAALDRFCLSLGAVAGDIALAHGATAVVIAGGLGYRLKDRLLPQSALPTASSPRAGSSGGWKRSRSS